MTAYAQLADQADPDATFHIANPQGVFHPTSNCGHTLSREMYDEDSLPKDASICKSCQGSEKKKEASGDDE